METAVEGYRDTPLHDNTTLHEEGAAVRLNKEIDRLRTFDNWPVDEIPPSELARWGFFYAGSRDVVRCFFCKIELAHWEATDVVPLEHLRWSRHCPLMRKLPTANVPLDANFLDQLADVVPDVTGSEAEPELNIGETFRGEPTNIASVPNEPDLQPDAIPVYRPKFPAYQIEAARVSSFKDWPKSIKQTAQQMADAGFFYTGKSDIVRCFCCGGALRDWMGEDDPWREHAVNFSGCAFVKLMKSEDFIGSSQRATLVKDSNSDQAKAAVPKPDEASDDEVPDDRCCKVCYNRPYDTVFMPCGHVVACRRCASSSPKCPLCNEQYTGIARIYLP